MRESLLGILMEKQEGMNAGKYIISCYSTHDHIDSHYQ
jgi:hypothetical protein